MLFSNKTGVSLFELLVVIGILTLLMGFLLTAVQSVRESSKRLHCQNQIRQIGLALHQFESQHGSLPQTIAVDRSSMGMFWQARLLPFLEETALYEEVQYELSLSESIRNHPHQLTTIPKLQCFSNPDRGLVIPAKFGNSFAFTDYCGMAGVSIDSGAEGVFPIRFDQVLNKVRFADITNGLSNTLAFGERPPNGTGRGYGIWLGGEHSSAASIGVFEDAEPFNFLGIFDACLGGPIGFRQGKRGMPCSALHHWSYHPGGANFARVDGSIGFIEYAIDTETLKRLATRAPGQ